MDAGMSIQNGKSCSVIEGANAESGIGWDIKKWKKGTMKPRGRPSVSSSVNRDRLSVPCFSVLFFFSIRTTRIVVEIRNRRWCGLGNQLIISLDDLLANT